MTKKATIDIRKADCMDLMSTMGGGTIDLIVTDPPYKIESINGSGSFGKKEFFSGLETQT